MVNANLTPFEREHDVNHQYSQCEKDGCDNPKNNKRHCTKHMYLDQNEQNQKEIKSK